LHFNPIIAADETTSLAELLGAFSYALDLTDFFDALTADRPCRAAMPAEKALAIMEGEAGRAIDPDCVEALRAVAG
jgi:hypothetical protein